MSHTHTLEQLTGIHGLDLSVYLYRSCIGITDSHEEYINA